MTSPAGAPVLPPLLRGRCVLPGRDPFAVAGAAAAEGADPGTVFWCEEAGTLSAALVLAPELPLADAVGVLFALQMALADSLGAVGPPEVAVHVAWPDRMLVNGATGPRWRLAASTAAPQEEPDWLVAAVTVPLAADRGDRPGDTPDRTTLAEEGFADLTGTALLESLTRHMLVWINRFVDDGFAPVGAAWSARCADIGRDLAGPHAGRMLGIDERGGLVLRRGERTETVPLTAILDAPWPNSPA